MKYAEYMVEKARSFSTMQYTIAARGVASASIKALKMLQNKAKSKRLSVKFRHVPYLKEIQSGFKAGLFTYRVVFDPPTSGLGSRVNRDMFSAILGKRKLEGTFSHLVYLKVKPVTEGLNPFLLRYLEEGRGDNIEPILNYIGNRDIKGNKEPLYSVPFENFLKYTLDSEQIKKVSEGRLKPWDPVEIYIGPVSSTGFYSGGDSGFDQILTQITGVSFHIFPDIDDADKANKIIESYHDMFGEETQGPGNKAFDSLPLEI